MSEPVAYRPGMLRHLPDVVLLRLQVNTLAIPARNEADAELLDHIGRAWQARKSAE